MSNITVKLDKKAKEVLKKVIGGDTIEIVEQLPTDNIDISKIYKVVKIRHLTKGWNGEVVPFKGMVNNLYFNSNISIEEVDKLLNTLTFTNIEGMDISGLYVSEDGLNIFAVVKNPYDATNLLIVKINELSPLSYDTIYDNQDLGWVKENTSFSVNANAVSDFMGLPIGVANESLVDIFSTEEFMYSDEEMDIYEECSYWRYENNKWNEVLKDIPTIELTLPENREGVTILPFTKEQIETCINNDFIHFILHNFNGNVEYDTFSSKSFLPKNSVQLANIYSYTLNKWQLRQIVSSITFSKEEIDGEYKGAFIEYYIPYGIGSEYMGNPNTIGLDFGDGGIDGGIVEFKTINNECIIGSGNIDTNIPTLFTTSIETTSWVDNGGSWKYEFSSVNNNFLGVSNVANTFVIVECDKVKYIGKIRANVSAIQSNGSNIKFIVETFEKPTEKVTLRLIVNKVINGI